METTLKKTIKEAIEVITEKGIKRILKKCLRCNNDEFAISEIEKSDSASSSIVIICLNCGFVSPYGSSQSKKESE